MFGAFCMVIIIKTLADKAKTLVDNLFVVLLPFLCARIVATDVRKKIKFNL